MNDAAFWASLSHALIAIGLVLMGAGIFLFYKMRLHKYIAIRRRQRLMGMPPAKKEKRKKHKKKTERQPEDKVREDQADDTDIPSPAIRQDDENGRGGTTSLTNIEEDGRGGTTSLTGNDENGMEETTYLTEEEKGNILSEGYGMTEELDKLNDQPGTTLLKKEQKEEADRLENGEMWIPASKTFRITKTVIITHGKKRGKNNG